MKIEGNTQKVELADVKIEQEVVVNARAEHVYDCYVKGVAYWWSKDWVMGGPKTQNIEIEAHPGGRLLESWEGGGGCVWAMVQSISPGRMISFSIPEGVMWSGAGFFRLVFEASEDAKSTTVRVTHHCFNMYQEDSHSGYVEGWSELIGKRLKDYAEGRDVEDSIRPGRLQA